MANKNYNAVHGRGFGIVLLGGSWATNGNGAVDNTLNIGDWFSVAYNISAGLYLLTLTEKFVGVYSAHMSVTSGDGTAYRAVLTPTSGTSLDTLVSTTGILPLSVLSGASTLGAPASNVANRVHMTFVMKNSSGA